MKIKKISLLSLLVGITLVVGMSSAQALMIDQSNSSNVDLETDELVINITGGSNVPKYTFWATGNDTRKYNVQFSQFFEAVDGSEGTANVYDPNADTKGKVNSLSSLKWEFSELVNDSNGDVHFNITSSDGVIQFRNHLFADEEASIKFDVVIRDYDFEDASSMLVLVFSLTETRAGTDRTPETEKETNRVRFGNGFFQLEETADVNGDTIDVGLSTGDNNGKKIYLSYENFDGFNMVHDPTMGVQSSGSTGDDTDNDGPALNASDQIQNPWVHEISKGVAGLTTLFATVIATLIPITLYKRKQ